LESESRLGTPQASPYWSCSCPFVPARRPCGAGSQPPTGVSVAGAAATGNKGGVASDRNQKGQENNIQDKNGRAPASADDFGPPGLGPNTPAQNTPASIALAPPPPGPAGRPSSRDPSRRPHRRAVDRGRGPVQAELHSGQTLLKTCLRLVLPDGPATRGAATSWRVLGVVWVTRAAWGLPLVGTNLCLPTNGRTTRSVKKACKRPPRA